MLLWLLASCVFLGSEDLAERMDADGDGVPRPQDCDDEDATVSTLQWFVDADADGYGSVLGATACTAPANHAAVSGDCDDEDPTRNPAAQELCDGTDNDCDGATDEDDAIDAATWYADADQDGFGDPAAPAPGCSAPAGHVADATDCDDGDASMYPGAAEVCDDVDHDCSGAADDVTWWPDADSDGFGDPDGATVVCPAPDGFVDVGTDCDDGDPLVHPEALEWCDNEVDDDCDGDIDDDDAVDALVWYVDNDDDGFGDPLQPATACQQPDGYAEGNDDCDDTRADIHPDAEEVWYDDVDQDCDEASDFDADRDGFDADAHGGTDCLDSDPLVHPDAEEACSDDLDNDCDGVLAGECALSGDVLLAEAEAVIVGIMEDDYVGSWVASAGDANGDDVGDVVISSTRAATLWFGPLSGEVDTDAADVRLCYTSTCDAGSTMHASGVGDTDGDGHDDVLVSRVSDSAYLALGPVTADRHLFTDADATISSISPYRLAGPGDANGDGLTDLLISNSSNGAYVYLGPVSGLLGETSADVHIRSDDSSIYAGRSVSWAGDVDGDGLDDVLVGVPWANGEGGAVALEFGAGIESIEIGDADVRWDRDADSSSCYAGMAVADAGDVDADGYDDILVGSANCGAWLVAGPSPSSGSLTALATAHFENETGTGGYYGGGAGRALDGAGDVNGDGRDDLLFGDYRLSYDAYSEAGGAYVVLGPVSGTVSLSSAEARLLGPGANALIGEAVGAAGDTNGDGFADVLVGGYRWDSTADNAGGAFLLLGGID